MIEVAVRAPRVDRPQILPGTRVWWKSNFYAVESLELQGQTWTAVLVRPHETGQPNVPCWFAPCRELRTDLE